MNERAPDTAATFDRALAFHQAGRFGEALEAYSRILAEDPTHLQALTYSGAALLEQSRTDEAVSVLRQAVAHAPADHAANAYLANALQIQDQLDESETCYRRALEAGPEDHRTLNNYGLLLRRLKRPDEAAATFRRAAEIQPDYADAFINHGEALIALGRLEEAIGAFRTATAAAPRARQAWLKLGGALSLAERHEEALEAIDHALRCGADDSRAHHARGRCLKALGRPEAAVDAYRAALDLAPNYHEARHNLGVALRIAGRPDEAIACYRDLLERRPDRPATQFNLGNALLEAGDVANAIIAYRAAIALRPDHLGAHKALNDLYWQQGRGDDYARSYEDAIRRAPRSVELRQQYARQLELVGSFAQAEAALNAAVRELGEQPSFSHRLAVVAGQQGNVAESLRQDYVVLLLTSGDYDRASAQLDAWERLSSDDQAMWAYRGLLWRLAGDERAAWLNDYDRFVRPIPLEPPASHRDLESFLAELGDTLTGLHPSAAHPLEQTLRGGTQTAGDLFNRQEPIIQALKGRIEDAIRSYIAVLPDDPSHPFLRRKTGRFAFAGSWSVRLKSDGFHVDHVHPRGWISSACYIELPETTKSAPAADRSGWIRFGQSPLGLGEADVPAKWIRPQEGVLVLFPSYAWHGTEAFASEAARMTVAFDAVPA